MRKPAYRTVVEKSRAACIAAVETYNRASTPYREETFAILMINAWELLLKARVIMQNNGKVKSVYEYEVKKKKDGTLSKRSELVMTRSGSPMTMGITKACRLVVTYPTNRIDEVCMQNVFALLDIRDNATHFVSPDPTLMKRLAEISLAAVKNYVIASQKWFGITYHDLNLASIPISFSLDSKLVDAVPKNRPEAVTKFLAHCEKLEIETKGTGDFAFSVSVQFDVQKKKVDGAVPVVIVPEGGDLTITVGDDRIPPGFDWDYEELIKRMKQRYSNFICNKSFHAIKRELEKEAKFCFVRRLNPKKKGGMSQKYYNPNIMTEFDKHYTRRETK